MRGVGVGWSLGLFSLFLFRTLLLNATLSKHFKFSSTKETDLILKLLSGFVSLLFALPLQPLGK